MTAGFASLDAMTAILLLCLAWSSLVPVTVGIIRNTQGRLDVQQDLYAEKNSQEEDSWYFTSQDDD